MSLLPECTIASKTNYNITKIGQQFIRKLKKQDENLADFIYS
jgi:predicted transcriptional regulator